MDGRKNNGGNKNAGRKPKADEIKLIEQMDAVLAPRSVWEALAIKVKDGDGQCIKTWLSYRHGMPKQQIEQTNINYNQDLADEDVKMLNKELEDEY
tara:strand:+ start:200 stop:487 length:288 start_codon:yes stop_codon:yes gene_type:complete